MNRVPALLTVLLLSGWTTVSAQSLAELAKKEKERREKLHTTEVKSYDETDLRRRVLSLPTAVPTEGEQASETEVGAPSASQEPEEESEEDPTRTEAYWRNRLAPIDKRITDIRAKLNAPGFAQDPSNMLRRQRMERDLEKALQDRQAVLEEARRKGIAPGWLR